MRFTSVHHTDQGKRAVNQDSVLIMEAEVRGAPLTMAVLCDGMGGLTQGEYASGKACETLQAWFKHDLPAIAHKGLPLNDLQVSLAMVLQQLNAALLAYSRERGISLGTTASILILFNDKYFMASIGDTRIYLLDGRTIQLSEDDTLINQEIASGRLSPIDAKHDPRRNVLTRCLGVSSTAVPHFSVAEIKRPGIFVLCSDGFYNTLKDEELYATLAPHTRGPREALQAGLVRLVEQAGERGERDNITAVAVGVA